jgi:hypothetical protein
MPDQLHDGRCTKPVTQVVCRANNPGPSRRTEEANREMEGQTDGPCCPSVHLCMAAAIGPVFGGGSIHSSAGYRRHSHSYMDCFDCLPFIVARSKSSVSSAETDHPAGHQYK